MKKNETITIEITGMTAEGSGVGRYEGMAVFVSGAAVGETVRARVIKAEKRYAIGKLEEIVKRSPDRTESDCAVSASCGGCAYRFLNYDAEKTIKYNRVRDAFLHIGGINIIPDETVGAVSTERYRNKALLPAAVDKNGKVVFGFYAGRSHRVIPCSDCLLQPEEFARIAEVTSRWAEKYGIGVYDERSGKGLLRHLCMRKAATTGEIMAVPVINAAELPYAKEYADMVVDSVPTVKSVMYNVNTERTNVVMGNKCVLLRGKPTVTDEICGVRLDISPLSFYQVNRDMAELLFKKVRQLSEPTGKTVIDLYCGIGAIGLSAAYDAEKLIGAEIIPDAVEDARRNAENNGICNARFIVGDAALAAEKIDAVILDPPRKGCSAELIRTVARDFHPERIVYVSCDPATLARDAALFLKEGYEVRSVTPFDLFPRTVHVETVILLSRKDVYERIKFDVNVEDLQGRASSTATYSEIKAYILEKYGLKVSSLYIAQIKDKCGFEKRDNYNIGEGKSKELICPPEKEQAIMDAFRHFGMLRD